MLARGEEIAATVDAKWWINHARYGSIGSTLLSEFPDPAAQAAPARTTPPTGRHGGIFRGMR